MIIALASQKGGTGKTTTAAVIWTAFPRSLAIDLDPQRNLSSYVGADRNAAHNIYSVLMGKCLLKDAVQTLDKGDIVASSFDVNGIATLPPLTLSAALTPVKEKYQHIVIDTPPVLNAVTMNALAAADVLIVPMQGDKFSLEGLDSLIGIVEGVRDEFNPRLKIGGLLLTRFNARAILRRQMRELAEEYAAKIGTRVFRATVRESVAISEAQAMEQDIFSYAPKANVTDDYRAFISELSEVLNNG